MMFMKILQMKTNAVGWNRNSPVQKTVSVNHEVVL